MDGLNGSVSLLIAEEFFKLNLRADNNSASRVRLLATKGKMKTVLSSLDSTVRSQPFHTEPSLVS